MEKKELTKSQIYAVRAAKQELQNLVDIVAEELGLDIKNESWTLLQDNSCFEKREVPSMSLLKPEEKEK